MQPKRVVAARQTPEVEGRRRVELHCHDRAVRVFEVHRPAQGGPQDGIVRLDREVEEQHRHLPDGADAGLSRLLSTVHDVRSVDQDLHHAPRARRDHEAARARNRGAIVEAGGALDRRATLEPDVLVVPAQRLTHSACAGERDRVDPGRVEQRARRIPELDGSAVRNSEAELEVDVPGNIDGSLGGEDVVRPAHEVGADAVTGQGGDVWCHGIPADSRHLERGDAALRYGGHRAQGHADAVGRRHRLDRHLGRSYRKAERRGRGVQGRRAGECDRDGRFVSARDL